MWNDSSLIFSCSWGGRGGEKNYGCDGKIEKRGVEMGNPPPKKNLFFSFFPSPLSYALIDTISFLPAFLVIPPCSPHISSLPASVPPSLTSLTPASRASPVSIRLCAPCHSLCCPRPRHMALSSLLLSSINTVVAGNYRHTAQHARLCSSLWCRWQNKALKDVGCPKGKKRNLIQCLSNRQEKSWRIYGEKQKLIIILIDVPIGTRKPIIFCWLAV